MVLPVKRDFNRESGFFRNFQDHVWFLPQDLSRFGSFSETRHLLPLQSVSPGSGICKVPPPPVSQCRRHHITYVQPAPCISFFRRYNTVMNKDTATICTDTQTTASCLHLPPDIRTIRCVGDSITEGWGLPDPQENAWPALLEHRFCGVRFENYGSAGAAVQSFLPNAWTSTLASHVALSRPAGLTLLFLGTNDSEQLTPHFADEYHSLLHRLSKDGPVITIVPPKTGIPALNRRLETIRQVILSAGVPVIDLWNTPVELGGDGMHPTIQGQQQMARHIAQSLVQLLRHTPRDCQDITIH